MGKVIKPNKDAPEDKALMHIFTLVSKLYWLFNVFTQIVESLDCLVHIWITVDCLSQDHTEISFLPPSIIMNIFSLTVKWHVFGSFNPFYFLINNFQSGKYSFSRFRLIQLYHRYNDIVKRFFKKRRSTNGTKNFGYLNVSILTRVYIEDFGAPRLPTPGFAIHELYESIPQCFLLFIYITYYQINNPLYTCSIILSLLCICCQIFNCLAMTNNIHYSVLSARFLCIVADIFGAFALFSFIYYIHHTAAHETHYVIGILVNIFWIKVVCITVPLTCALSYLFVLRSVSASGIQPPINIYRLVITLPIHMGSIFSLHMITLAMTCIAAVFFDCCVNFYWCSLVIHRLCNQRFSYWDGNNNFWRRIIEWMLEQEGENHREQLQSTPNIVLKLFSVNFNLCANVDKFKDNLLKIWMDDVYKYVFYTYFTTEYRITSSDFNKYSKTDISDNYKSVYEMILNEQIKGYFKGTVLNDIMNNMADSIEGFIVTRYIFDRNQMVALCRFILDALLYFTSWIVAPLYLISSIVNVIFPLIVMVFASDLSMRSFPFIIGLCYYLSILMLLVQWFVNINIFGYYIQCGYDVSSLIYSLCPSLMKQGELYVSLRHGYFTQHELFERMLWYYNRHKSAQMIGKHVVDIFGKDIAREIFDFFPRCYSEEKLFIEQNMNSDPSV